MVTGYWVSKTLMTAVEFEVFTKLSDNKAVTFEQLQNDILEMERRPAEAFATALVSLGLITVNNGGEEKKKKVYST
jgi:Dimerisation domain